MFDFIKNILNKNNINNNDVVVGNDSTTGKAKTWKWSTLFDIFQSMFISTSRNINTQYSIIGGGDLTADRTLILVNDAASPGNNKLYGTNSSGTRGWYDIPNEELNIISNQNQFNAIFERTSANNYKIKDVITSIQIKKGIYYCYDTSSFLSDGDTYAIIDTNYCTSIEAEIGTIFNISNTGFRLDGNPNNLVNKLYVSGITLNSNNIGTSYIYNYGLFHAVHNTIFDNCEVNNVTTDDSQNYFFKSEDSLSQCLNCRINNLDSTSTNENWTELISGFSKVDNIILLNSVCRWTTIVSSSKNVTNITFYNSTGISYITTNCFFDVQGLIPLDDNGYPPFKVIVRNQADFNNLFERISENNYKIKDDITSIYIQKGDYYGISVNAYNVNDTHYYIDSNLCTYIYAETGTKINTCYKKYDDTYMSYELALNPNNTVDKCLLQNVCFSGYSSNGNMILGSDPIVKSYNNSIIKNISFTNYIATSSSYLLYMVSGQCDGVDFYNIVSSTTGGNILYLIYSNSLTTKVLNVRGWSLTGTGRIVAALGVGTLRDINIVFLTGALEGAKGCDIVDGFYFEGNHTIQVNTYGIEYASNGARCSNGKVLYLGTGVQQSVSVNNVLVDNCTYGFSQCNGVGSGNIVTNISTPNQSFYQCYADESNLVSVNSTTGSPAYALASDLTGYLNIISTQTEFNNLFERTSANNYKIKDNITSIYIKMGDYFCDGSTFITNGDSSVIIDTNNCSHIYCENGTRWTFSNIFFKLSCNSNNLVPKLLIENLTLKGDGTSLQLGNLIEAHNKTKLKNIKIDSIKIQDGSDTAIISDMESSDINRSSIDGAIFDNIDTSLITTESSVTGILGFRNVNNVKFLNFSGQFAYAISGCYNVNNICRSATGYFNHYIGFCDNVSNIFYENTSHDISGNGLIYCDNVNNIELQYIQTGALYCNNILNSIINYCNTGFAYCNGVGSNNNVTNISIPSNSFYQCFKDVGGALYQLDSVTGLDLVPNKNYFLNSNFDWDRIYNGGNITNPIYNQTTLEKMAIIADFDGGTPPTLIHSRKALTSGAVLNSNLCYNINTNGAGSGFGNNFVYIIYQFIQNGVKKLCGVGKSVTMSFWAKSTTIGKKLGVRAYMNYGTGGSPSSLEILNGATFTLSSSWTKYSYTFITNTLVGKTFGTNNDDFFAVDFWLGWGDNFISQVGASSAESFVGAGDISITQVKVESGSIATPYIPEVYEEEKKLLTDINNTGWIPFDYALVYVNSSTAKIVGVDLTSWIKKGLRLKYNDGSGKYAYVSADSTLSGGDTQFTIIGNTFANATITGAYWSIGTPTDFPETFSYTPGVASGAGVITSYTINIAKYQMSKDCVKGYLDLTITNAGTGSSGLYVDLPIGTNNNGTLSGREVTQTGNSINGQIQNQSNMTIFKYDNSTIIATNNRICVWFSYFL